MICTAFMMPLQATAWGRDGHAMIAEVAVQRLSGNAQAQVTNLLDGMPPDEAASWMDAMRRNGRYRYMQHWHYINISKDSSYQPGGKDDIIYALEQSFLVLKNKLGSDSQRREALLILMHLMGDLHQPLHTGYATDKGANKLQVNISGRKGTNLHHLWDSDIIQRKDITLQTVISYGKTLTPSALAAIQRGDVISWMSESRGHLPHVYQFTGHTVDEVYMRNAEALVTRQLFVAGVRLAAVLNTIFNSRSARNGKQK